MADFTSTRKNSSLEEWGEALELLFMIKGVQLDMTESDIEAAYYAQLRVDTVYEEYVNG